MNDNEYEMNLWAMTVPINYLEYMYKEYSINYPPTLSFENEINIKIQDKVDWKKEGF
jgi:hypothetical protein